jgi:hypothetical protein
MSVPPSAPAPPEPKCSDGCLRRTNRIAICRSWGPGAPAGLRPQPRDFGAAGFRDPAMRHAEPGVRVLPPSYLLTRDPSGPQNSPNPPRGRATDPGVRVLPPDYALKPVAPTTPMPHRNPSRTRQLRNSTLKTPSLLAKGPESSHLQNLTMTAPRRTPAAEPLAMKRCQCGKVNRTGADLSP